MNYDVVSLFAVTSTVAAALFGAWAAIAASIAARAARKSAEAALLKEFSDAYMDSTMNHSLYALRHWAEDYGPDFGRVWWDALGARKRIDHPDYQRALMVDEARQKVKGYFATADRLYQLGAINRQVFHAICNVYAVNVFIDIVQCLERAERPSWQPILADKLEKLRLKERQNLAQSSRSVFQWY